MNEDLRKQAWISRFNQLDTLGWNTKGWLHHQDTAAQFLKYQIRNLLSDGARILEIGSGNGRTIAILAKEFPEMNFVASDFIQCSIHQIMNETVGSANISVICFDAHTAHAEMYNQYDLIFSIGDASALAQRESLENIFPNLIPGQLIVMDLINHLSISNLIKFWTLPKIFMRYLRFCFDNQGKTYHFWKFGLTKMLQKYNMEPIEIKTVFNNYGFKSPIYIVSRKK